MKERILKLLGEAIDVVAEEGDVGVRPANLIPLAKVYDHLQKAFEVANKMESDQLTLGVEVEEVRS